jgi:D-alanyl-lipoteichoic acid acyltransferase DltB (MBOAT superfamily)
MLLSSSTYFLFLCALFLVYWPASRMRAVCLSVILFANYFFYAKWDLFYLFLIPAASAVDYAIALGMSGSRSQAMRRMLLSGSLVMNLGLLVSLKYVPFLLGTWSVASGQPAPVWHWTFPLGISFYAFQSLSYTLDVYRRDAKPVGSLLTYLSAVSFFPTTLAGPITRPAVLAPQLEKPKILSAADGGRALFLIGLGLIKKLLIADYLADNLVTRVFDYPKLYSAAETLVGVYAYAFQLYFDFSGYTDVAIGSALLLGLRLPPNFNVPYLAQNIAEFWRRWHITLSNWLRDYLYFSLPGKRTVIGPYAGLVITMVLGGLWHGPSWTFVIWGLLHGIGLAVQRGWQSWRGGTRNPSTWAAMARVALTFHFVCFAWIFFRANSFANARDVILQLGSGTWSLANISLPVALVLSIAALSHFAPMEWLDRSRDRFAGAPFYVQATLLMLLAIGLQYIAATGAAPFIYTRF